MSPTWYDVLGVERDAHAEQIRAAWRRSIADLDPTDRRFRSSNEAAEVLLDPGRRASYDATLPEREPAPAPEPAASDPYEAGSPGPGAEPVRTGSTAKSGRTRSRRPVPVLLLAAVGLVAAALVVLAAVVWTRPYVDPQSVQDAETAAEQAIVPVLSYDYRHLDEDSQTALGYLTPSYQDDYKQLFSVISANAPAAEAVVRAEVVASSVVRTGPGRVDVLLFVNRPTTNKQVTTPIVYRDQVTVSMVDDSGEWLVDQLSTTPPPA